MKKLLRIKNGLTERMICILTEELIKQNEKFLRVDKNNVKEIIRILRENDMVIPIISDSVFKSLFRDEDMRGILSLLISKITGINYDIVFNGISFKDSYLGKNNITHKDNYTDLIVDIKDNIIMIEMSSHDDVFERIRNSSHFHNEVVKSFIMSLKPKDIRFVYQIVINDKSNSDNLIDCFMMRDQNNNIDISEANFKKFNVNLSYFDKKGYNINELDKFERALLIIKENNIKDLRELAGKDEDLINMVKKVEDMSRDPKIVKLFDDERLRELAKNIEIEKAKEEGHSSGFEEGQDSGIKKNKLETAKKMIEKKIDIKTISDITGLSLDEIKNL